MSVKVMLQETIRNNDFEPKTALQHWCDIVSDSYNIVSTLQGHPRDCGFMSVKVMLQETIRNNDFEPKTALQHWCDIVSDSYNIVSTLQGCVALKIVVANRPV